MYGTEEVDDVLRPSTLRSPKLFNEMVGELPLELVVVAFAVVEDGGVAGMVLLGLAAIEVGSDWEEWGTLHSYDCPVAVVCWI